MADPLMAVSDRLYIYIYIYIYIYLLLNLALGKAERPLSDVAATTKQFCQLYFKSYCIEDRIIVWGNVAEHFTNSDSVSFACLFESE